MSIWLFPDSTAVGLNEQSPIRSCRFCNCGLTVLAGPNHGAWPGVSGTTTEHPATLQVCQACGWWLVERRSGYAHGSYEGSLTIGRLGGVLRWLDLSDASTPVEQLRTYLLAKYESRFNVNPRRFEEIVAGVFADFGFTVRVTSFSGDDGIDVIVLDNASGDTIGVQVKRYKGRVEAEQIRAFAGALVLGGMTQGVFVATSGFTQGARSTAQRYCERGVSVELTDGLRFFEALKITQRPQYRVADDSTAPFFEPFHDPDCLPIVAQMSW